MAEQGFRITYATMSADNEELHKLYDQGIEVANSWLGSKHPLYVNGEAREGSEYKTARSPIDGRVIGEFAAFPTTASMAGYRNSHASAGAITSAVAVGSQQDVAFSCAMTALKSARGS